MSSTNPIKARTAAGAETGAAKAAAVLAVALVGLTFWIEPPL